MPEPEGGLSLHLRAGGPTQRGHPLSVSIQLRNCGPRRCLLVGVLDGSESCLRYPHYRPQIVHDGAVVAAPEVSEDPLVGPLRAVDFVRLDPGGAFDPSAGHGAAAFLPLTTFTNFVPTESGIYVCTLEFSTESLRTEDWLGRFNQDAERDVVLDLIADVPRVTLRAEPLQMFVR
ncbi:hypothetical protein P3H15_28130 [Rhodococcus sp. T2V]|uniref:hypothetical protein n=1 Tax=Rhodococcus sp. T2V TaxID=3034164 RepID=UPI0023E1C512|nr:hypothetical protein [Rhodococcus sp. T2V]MDF3308887.1 hypothetical protein [Rhodococcus sp. T2V]